MRSTAQRPLPALLAILFLIGTLCLVSMWLGSAKEHHVAQVTVSVEATE